MTRGRFTPGPWKVLDNNPSYFPSVQIGPKYRYPDGSGSDTDTITINCGLSPEEAEEGTGFGTTDETARANAYLIAAAPTLYAALLRLNNTVSESVPDYTQWVQGIAAEALALVDGDDPADICRDCGHTPATGACSRCKMD